MRRALCILLAVGVLACSRRRGPPSAGDADAAADEPDACAPVPTHRVARRFALGVIPHHPSGSHANLSKCWIEFTPSGTNGAVAIDPSDQLPHVVREGTFSGTCNGKPSSLVFEGVKAVSVDVAASSWQSEVDRFSLDSARPDRAISIEVVPRDGCGRPLDRGFTALARDRLHGHARWKMTADCERVIRPMPYDWQAPGIGFDRPADGIRLFPISRGTCTLEVAYFDARGRVTITTH